MFNVNKLEFFDGCRILLLLKRAVRWKEEIVTSDHCIKISAGKWLSSLSVHFVTAAVA